MNAHGASFLHDTGESLIQLLGHVQHEIVKIINHNNQIRQASLPRFRHFLILGGDVARLIPARA
jgi:hypothetical protein